MHARVARELDRELIYEDLQLRARARMRMRMIMSALMIIS